MTALPVQLDPGPEPELPPAGWTPLRIGLVLAWIAAIIAFAAVGFAGWRLIDLAERRIRFVSAVTHELRTPLTSLRLYLDLLVSGMIQDEAKRQEYLEHAGDGVGPPAPADRQRARLTPSWKSARRTATSSR